MENGKGESMSKYVFVTGGVVSSLGKGVTAASIARCLLDRGLRVNMIKLDPSLNVDTGNLNPHEHSEVFVTCDGMQGNVDLGYYERFLDIECRSNCYVTAGKVVRGVLEKDANGEYLGATISTVPHVTSEWKSYMRSAGSPDTDVVVVEVGGVVGDIENAAMLEAIRQFERELKYGGYVHVHVTLVPYLHGAGEVKTKPTQHSVKELGAMGLQPDLIICRTDADVNLIEQDKKKIAMFCGLDDPRCVIHEPDCESIYEVPLILSKQGADMIICQMLGLKVSASANAKWHEMVDVMTSNLPVVNIALVGKYLENKDAYLTVMEAIKSAGYKLRKRVNIDIISAEDIEMLGAKEALKNYAGVVIPGGFGTRGVEGKIATAKYCRENIVPMLGIALGMQAMVIEFARSVAHLSDANSLEVNSHSSSPVIIKGDTAMRLGNDDVHLKDGTLARRIYGMPDVEERHRNAYEFNNAYREKLENLGLVVSGINSQKDLVEVVELKDHPFYVGTIFEPEFRSRPLRPHPIFLSFLTQVINSEK